MPPIHVFSATDQMGPSCVGARVLDPEAFLALLVREIEETGEAQGFDGEEGTIIQLRPEVVSLVSAGHGPRRSA